MRPDTYKHILNTDVAMKVVKSYYIPEKNGWKLRVIWLNVVNPSNVFPLNIQPDKVFLNREDLKNWKVCNVGI